MAAHRDVAIALAGVWMGSPFLALRRMLRTRSRASSSLSSFL